VVTNKSKMGEKYEARFDIFLPFLIFSAERCWEAAKRNPIVGRFYTILLEAFERRTASGSQAFYHVS
jgi:hypothetical protein